MHRRPCSVWYVLKNEQVAFLLFGVAGP
uniref:Uncharacterized protein n=1 Tax=Rhizophora mucronata TaxID=61149 RepID=A0A2P2PDK9_RHIMU